ncbi:MAG: hypothetical protein JSU90_09930, partial [Nitrospiraceae bacterium]
MEKRITIALYLIMIVTGLFILRLWYLQVIRGNEYRAIDERNRQRVLHILPPRGIIYDRSGNPLVKNVPSFDITAVREDISMSDEALAALGSLIGLDRERTL